MPTPRAGRGLDVSAHLAEEIHDTGENDKEDTASGAQSEHLGQETLVKSGETLLAHDGAESGPCPVVLGYGADDLGGVLDARLYDVHGGVEDGTDGATDGTGDEIVCDLALLGGGGRDELADLEDAAKVSCVPENVAPHGGLEALVEGERALVLHRLREAVDHAVVLVRLRLVLETDLDELEGDDNEGLGRSGGGTREDGERLRHLLLAEQIAVEGTPGVVGRELGGPVGFSTGAEVGIAEDLPLRRLHENRRADTTVQSRGAA
jgi:hypothetical protein